MIKVLLDEIYNDEILWQMSRDERFALIQVIKKLNTHQCAVELGTYCGGSLRAISKYFNKVYSIDITDRFMHPSVKNLGNVEFIKMDSLTGLSGFMSKVPENTSFFLIDANHEYDYVVSDLNNVLTFVPTTETVIIVHDSWYPPSRMAICHSNLAQCPYVHFVDMDFCRGEVTSNRVMVGGMCLILMLPQKRIGELVLQQSSDLSYRMIRDSQRL